jgi:hypothetical protein
MRASAFALRRRVVAARRRQLVAGYGGQLLVPVGAYIAVDHGLVALGVACAVCGAAASWLGGVWGVPWTSDSDAQHTARALHQWAVETRPLVAELAATKSLGDRLRDLTAPPGFGEDQARIVAAIDARAGAAGARESVEARCARAVARRRDIDAVRGRAAHEAPAGATHAYAAALGGWAADSLAAYVAAARRIDTVNDRLLDALSRRRVPRALAADHADLLAAVAEHVSVAKELRAAWSREDLDDVLVAARACDVAQARLDQAYRALLAHHSWPVEGDEPR